MPLKLQVAIFAGGLCYSLHAQGTFQNLDFESANLSPIPAGQYGGEVPLSSALPGWNASIGGVALTQVLQNSYDLGQASIDILGPNWSYVNPGIIGGTDTVYLQSGGSPGNSTDTVNVSLWQYGSIPGNAQSLEFSTYNALGSSPLSVSFDGNSLSSFLLSSGQTPSGQVYDIYGANIALYAGQIGQLKFTAQFPNWTELDDITFSPTAVPEPIAMGLSGLGGLMLAFYRRGRPRR